MASGSARQLNLEDLAQGLGAINKVMGAFLAQAGAVCLDKHRHPDGVVLSVQGSFDARFEVYRVISTEDTKLIWKDEIEAANYGACAFAVLLVRELTPLMVVERACIGTGVDYWLGEKDQLPFQKKARLEVSGINQGTESAINARVKKKLAQTAPSDGKLPAYIVVVEFSRPTSHVVKK